MRHNHTSLKAKMQKNPHKTFKDLKSKQKEKIADWLYIETYRFYQQNARMPDKTERDTILAAVYDKIKAAAIWIPFEEVTGYYRKKLPHYEPLILRELDEGVVYPTRAERLAAKAAKPKPPKKRKKKQKPADSDLLDFDDDMDGDFAFIAGYTDGGAPYGLRWEDVGIPSELPYDVKRALYRGGFPDDDM